jgi:hypothetical protein
MTAATYLIELRESGPRGASELRHGRPDPHERYPFPANQRSGSDVGIICLIALLPPHRSTS